MSFHLRIALLAIKNAISLPHENIARKPEAWPHFSKFLCRKKSVKYGGPRNEQ